MNAASKFVLAAFTAALLTGGLCGCGDETPGEALDKALDKTGDEVKKAGDAIKPHK